MTSHPLLPVYVCECVCASVTPYCIVTNDVSDQAMTDYQPFTNTPSYRALPSFNFRLKNSIPLITNTSWLVDKNSCRVILNTDASKHTLFKTREHTFVQKNLPLSWNNNIMDENSDRVRTVEVIGCKNRILVSSIITNFVAKTAIYSSSYPHIHIQVHITHLHSLHVCLI